jgi:hypothetical protein
MLFPLSIRAAFWTVMRYSKTVNPAQCSVANDRCFFRSVSIHAFLPGSIEFIVAGSRWFVLQPLPARRRRGLSFYKMALGIHRSIGEVL